jgi:anti-sigma regulatory factor (Ser/Thr protein kinase)
MPSDANTLSMTYPAEPDSVARARHALSEFAATAGADRQQVEAVRLAASEAVTNAVLHAYRGDPGSVHVTAAVVSDELWILICDDGCGLEARPDRPGLGLGLALISQVSDELAVVPRASGGTEVRMRFVLVKAPSVRVAREGRAGAVKPRLLNGLPPDAWLPCRASRRARRPA